MKYIVTGGLGFIGSNICRTLLEKGHQITIVDNSDSQNNQRILDFKNEVDLCEIDIRQKEQLEKICTDVHGIFHNASLIDVQESYQKKEEYHSVNVIGTKNIFEIARDLDIKVIFASSASVYGDTKTIPIDEKFERNPINPYGQNKLEGELAAERFSKNELNVIGLRYFNVYGIGQTKTYAGVITQFLRRLKENKPPLIFGEGSQIRDFIHVNDVAEANVVAMQSNIENDFLNIGSGIGTSILDLARLMIKLSKKKFEPVFDSALEGDVQFSQANIKHTKNMLGWEPRISLENGISSIMNELKL